MSNPFDNVPVGNHNPNDTDTGPLATHHTLGPKSNQAAKGDHKHAGIIPVLGTIAQYIRGDLSLAILDKIAVGLSNVPNVDMTNLSNALSGTIPDARLPARIGNRGNVNGFGGDWNLARQPGTYSGDTASNAPGAGWWLVNVQTHDDAAGNLWVTQTAHAFTADGVSDTKIWRRTCHAGTWEAWYRLRWSQTELDVLYQAVISAGTTGQYWRGDKTWQTLDKTAVGLGNVDNTSDVNKPVSTAQANSIATKQDKLPVGTVIEWYGAKANCPAGFLVMDGSTFSAVTYPALNTLLGGTTLPNFTDKFSRGPAAGATSGGATGGADSAGLPAHTHNTPNHAHNITIQGATNTTATGAASRVTVVNGVSVSGVSQNAPTSGTDGAGVSGNPNTTPTIATVPSYIALWKIIKAN